METIKRSDKPTLRSLVVVEKGYGLKGIGNVVGCRRYSSKTKLSRVTSYVLRLIAKIKKRTANNMYELSADELSEAEEKWIRDVQSDEFPAEVLRECVTCKIFEGNPYGTYKLPDLPSWPTIDVPPFSYTGLDFAGPLVIKEESKCSQ